jgi:NADPH-dependent curcumin reductase CurA
MDNRRIVLAERPHGLIDGSTTRLETAAVPECGAGEALVRVGTVSIDPTIRGWMDDAPGYLPPIGLGEVIRSGGAGVVVESRNDRYAVGDVVFGMTGWQEYCVADDSVPFFVLPKGTGLDLPTVMNALGSTALTAYFGIIDVGELKSGDVVVVSGAAGATGSVAGQVARAKGASRVIGIAGGPDKCREVVELYGFDECLDYKEPRLRERLASSCPQGVDVYFDNVGGEILDDVLANIAMHARIVLCGAISQYNVTDRPYGVQNTFMLIVRRGRARGFIVLDFADRFLEGQMALAQMLLEGRLVHREHLVDGIERAPEALNMLFSGANHGKVLVVVDGSVALA